MKKETMQYFVNEFKDREGNTAKIYFEGDKKQYVVKFYDPHGTHVKASDFRTKSRLEAFKKAMPKGVEI